MAIPFDLISQSEYCDFALSEERDESEVRKSLAKAMGEVLKVNDARYIGRKRKSLVEITDRLVYRMSFEPPLSQGEIEHLIDSAKGRKREGLDIPLLIDSIYNLPHGIGTESSTLEFSVSVKDGRTPKPRDLCAWLCSLLESRQGEVSIWKAATLGRTSQGDFVSLLELPTD